MRILFAMRKNLSFSLIFFSVSLLLFRFANETAFSSPIFFINQNVLLVPTGSKHNESQNKWHTLLHTQIHFIWLSTLWPQENAETQVISCCTFSSSKLNCFDMKMMWKEWMVFLLDLTVEHILTVEPKQHDAKTQQRRTRWKKSPRNFHKFFFHISRSVFDFTFFFARNLIQNRLLTAQFGFKLFNEWKNERRRSEKKTEIFYIIVFRMKLRTRPKPIKRIIFIFLSFCMPSFSFRSLSFAHLIDGWWAREEK